MQNMHTCTHAYIHAHIPTYLSTHRQALRQADSRQTDRLVYHLKIIRHPCTISIYICIRMNIDRTSIDRTKKGSERVTTFIASVIRLSTTALDGDYKFEYTSTSTILN